MDDIIYNDPLGDEGGVPAQPDKLHKWRQGRCVYCGTLKSDDKKQCRKKTLLEVGLSEEQTGLLLRSLFGTKRDAPPARPDRKDDQRTFCAICAVHPGGLYGRTATSLSSECEPTLAASRSICVR